jgi:putative tail protein
VIHVQTIKNIFNPSGRVTRSDSAGRTVLSYLPEDFGNPESVRVLHNDECLDLYTAGKRLTRDQDVVIFYRKPGIETIIIALVISLVLTGITYGVTALTAPSTRSSRNELEDSPTYGFGGLVNTVRPGTRIPIVYGEHRVGGHIIQQFLRPGDGEDARVGVLNSLIAVCSGPIDSITGLRIDKNPASDFGNPPMIPRLGTLHQSPIDGFHEVTTQVTRDIFLSAIQPPTQVTTQGEVDFFELIFRFGGGLFTAASNGSIQQKKVFIRIEHREAGDTTWIDDGVKTISGKTSSPFDSFFRSTLLGRAVYEIRITRLTADDTTTSGFSDCTLLAVNEILDDVQTYPRIALYSVQQLPTNQVSGRTPQYDVMVRGKLVRVYTDAVTYTEEWSDNPAWCGLDLLTNRLDGLGAWIDHSNCDIEEMIEFADFCTLKNFHLNIVLDGSLSAFDAIRQICTVGRGFFLHRGDKWSFRAEKEEEPVQVFTMGRIGKGTFGVVKESRAEKANLIFGEFSNKELDYEQDSLPKEDQTLLDTDEQVEGTVNLIGATDSAHVNTLLNYLILTNRLSRRMVEFEVGVEAIAMQAGEVFGVAHDVPGWGFSGKIREIDETGTLLWLDRTVTIEPGKTYEVTVPHDTMGVNDVILVTSNPGTTDRISVSGDWSTMPTARQDYSFGEVNRSFAKYRCTSITRGSAKDRRKLRGREYNAATYGTDLTVLPAPSVSRLADPLLIPPDVTDLRLAERVVFAQDGGLSAAIDVHFTLPIWPGARAEVFWRLAGDTLWESVGVTTVGYFSITENVQSPGATYQVAVASLSQAGNRKHPDACPQVEITTAGVLRQPDKVAGFRVDRTSTGLVFSWLPIDPIKNFDLDYYEVRNGTTWDAALTIGKTSGTVLETGLFAKGTQSFLLKAFNTSGRGSFEPAVVVTTIDGRVGENVVFTKTEDPTFPGVKVNMSVVSSKLELQTSAMVVAWRAMVQTSSLGGSQYIPGGRSFIAGGFSVSGSYTTDVFQVTAGAAVRSIISTVLDQLQVDSSLYWTATGIGTLDWESEFARTRAWAVAPDGSISIRVEMRFSTATSAETDFGPWQERAQNTEALVKYAQARIFVEVLDPAFTVQIVKFRILFDVPDVTDSGTVTTSASASVPVTFAKFFNNAPKVIVSVLGATSGDTMKHTAVTTTGFNMEVFDSGGSRVVRTVEWVANGF